MNLVVGAIKFSEEKGIKARDTGVILKPHSDEEAFRQILGLIYALGLAKRVFEKLKQRR